DNAIGNPLQTTVANASFSIAAGDTVTYTLDTTNRSSSGGIPGVIEYCVYVSPLPTTTAPSYGAWGVGSQGGGFSFIRNDGDPANIPLDGTTGITVGTGTWPNGTAPTSQTILLHINDPAECNRLYQNGSLTCFVFPGPPPAASSVVTAIHNPAHVDITGSTQTAPITVHDKATVTISPSSVTIPSGSTVTFKFFDNDQCTINGNTTSQDVSITGSSGASVESTAQTLAAGTYSYKASFNSGNTSLVASSQESGCETLSVAQETPPLGSLTACKYDD